MRSVEVNAKTVDEAILEGLDELEAGIDEVEIDIVRQGSRGLLGIIGRRDAIVTLTMKEQEPTAANIEEAETFLNGLFDRMKVSASCQATEGRRDTIQVEISGKDTAVLIGRRGDTLDELQYLTGLVVNRGKDEYRKVMLDAENYRAKRERTLERLAKRLGNKAIRSGKPVKLEPMNPYERRILHATLQSNNKLETFSEGEEPYRRVVIRRKRRERAGK